MTRIRFSILLTALGLTLACSGPAEDHSPRMTAVLVVAYAQVGAAASLYGLLDPEDQQVLAREAARLSSSGHPVLPHDLLVIRVPPRDVAMAEPDVKTLEQNADELHLEVGFGERSRYLLRLRRTQGRWRLRLPVSVKP